MELKRVVVTGLGAITPLGNDVPSTWAALLEGVSGAGPITLFDASEFKTQFACQVKDFDPLKYFNAKEVRKLDRYTQFALAATQEGIADSGLDLETVNKDRAGVIFSAGIGGISTFEQEVGNYAVAPEKGPRFNPFFIPKMIADIAAGQISMIYGFRGPVSYRHVHLLPTPSSTHITIYVWAKPISSYRVEPKLRSPYRVSEDSMPCTHSPQEMIRQKQRHVRSALRATDSLWAKEVPASFLKNWNTHWPAGLKSMPKS